MGVHFGDFCPRGLLKGVLDHGGSFGAFLAKGFNLEGFLTTGVIWAIFGQGGKLGGF